MKEDNLDIMALAETHLKDSDAPLLSSTGMKWVGINRNQNIKQGGGVGFILRENFQVERLKTQAPNQIEAEFLFLKVKFNKCFKILGVVYFPAKNHDGSYRRTINGMI